MRRYCITDECGFVGLVTHAGGVVCCGIASTFSVSLQQEMSVRACEWPVHFPNRLNGCEAVMCPPISADANLRVLRAVALTERC